MKTLKIGMFAAALLLIFAGCNNAVAPTPYSESEFTKNADEYGTSSGYDFKVEETSSSQTIEVTPSYLGEPNDYLVKIKFTNAPDEESLKTGVKFYELSNSENHKPYLMPKKTELTSSLIDLKKEIAYFKVTKENLKYLYCFIDAEIVKAANGVKLNQDDDQVYGEKHDDSYAFYKQIDGTAPSINSLGNVNFNKKARSLTSTLKSGNDTINLTSVFPLSRVDVGGTAADAPFVKNFEISNTTFYNSYIRNLDLTDAEKEAKYAEMTDLLNKHLKIEQYDWKKAEWIDVPVTFNYVKDDNKWVTGDVTSKLEKNRKLRYKIVDMHDIEINFKNCYGYPIKAFLKNTEPRVKTGDISTIYIENYTCYYSSLEEGDTWKFSDTELNVTTNNGSVTIKFSPKLDDTYSVFKDSAWNHDVTAAKKGESTKTLYKGFDKTTINNNSFKCIKDGEVMAIKSVEVRHSDINKPDCFDEIYIEFVNKNENADSVYISPDIRTLPFDGSYKGGTEAYPIPAMGFAQHEASNDPNKLFGWLKK